MKDEPPETQPPKPGEMQEAGKFRTMADVLAKRLEGLKTGIVMKNEPQEYIAPHRRINSGQVWGTILFVAVIGGGAWYLINNFRTQSRENHATETRQQQTDASIAALALKYNAVTNWAAALSNRVFSIDVSRALIRSNGQPVLIKMDLKDVAENNGGYTALFGKDDITNGTFQLSVELKCTQEQANQLLKKTDSGYFQTYAVVARFDKVVRPKFQMTGSFDGEDASIELDASPDVFLVKGELLDAIRLSPTKHDSIQTTRVEPDIPDSQ
jgi:hypothetical protein